MPYVSSLLNINPTFAYVVEVLDLLLDPFADVTVDVVHLVLLASSFYFYVVSVFDVDFVVVVSHYDVQYGIMTYISTNDSFR